MGFVAQNLRKCFTLPLRQQSVADVRSTFDLSKQQPPKTNNFQRTTPHLLRRRAFTLIEVVIALAIFAAAAVVLSQAFTNALLAREHGVSNDEYEADIRTVRMQLLLEPNLDDAEDGGEIATYKNGEASWQAVIEPTNVVDLFRVELQVQFAEAQEGQDNAYSETLYLLRPTWSEADERSDLLADKKEELESNRDFR